jgi:DNA-binding NtrC family response regulator
VLNFAPGVLDRLAEYTWPGNVRELHNVIERAVSFAENDTIELRDLPEDIAWPHGALADGAIPPSDYEGRTDAVQLPDVRMDVDGTFKDAKERWIASFEREYIGSLLKKNNGNISHAARESEIDRKYFRKLMKKYGLTAESGDDDAPE